jgi:DNA-binding PadR family transcriptional regulator
MTSAVNWALLGLVIERPSYGLELYHRYERAYSDVLPVSSRSHIYTALDVLQARGLIERIPDRDAAGRQPKPHYRATRMGVNSYEEWLVEQVDAQLRQQQLWVRQLAIFAADPAEALRVLHRYRNRFLAGAGDVGLTADSSATRCRDLVERLVVEQQRIAVGGMLTWLQTAHAYFEHLAGSAGDDAPRT